MIGGHPTVPRSDIHFVLSNPRRRSALEYLRRARGLTSVRELSEHVAATETGVTPPPRTVRETVYVSLTQTHLPALAEIGVIAYDDATKEVKALDTARDVRVYMEVVTWFGITWDEYYRYLGILALLVIMAVEFDVPLVAAVDLLVWVTVFLGVFAVSMLYQFRRVAQPLVHWVSRRRQF